MTGLKPDDVSGVETVACVFCVAVPGTRLIIKYPGPKGEVIRILTCESCVNPVMISKLQRSVIGGTENNGDQES